MFPDGLTKCWCAKEGGEKEKEKEEQKKDSGNGKVTLYLIKLCYERLRVKMDQWQQEPDGQNCARLPYAAVVLI